MLKLYEIQTVKQLRSDGLSVRAITRQCRLDRKTVTAILRGHHDEREQMLLADRSRVAQEGGGDELGLFEGPPTRCPSCGGMVFLPCLACRTRAQMAAAVHAEESGMMSSQILRLDTRSRSSRSHRLRRGRRGLRRRRMLPFPSLPVSDTPPATVPDVRPASAA